MVILINRIFLLGIFYVNMRYRNFYQTLIIRMRICKFILLFFVNRYDCMFIRYDVLEIVIKHYNIISIQ